MHNSVNLYEANTYLLFKNILLIGVYSRECHECWLKPTSSIVSPFSYLFMKTHLTRSWISFLGFPCTEVGESLTPFYVKGQDLSINHLQHKTILGVTRHVSSPHFFVVFLATYLIFIVMNTKTEVSATLTRGIMLHDKSVAVKYISRSYY